MINEKHKKLISIMLIATLLKSGSTPRVIVMMGAKDLKVTKHF